MASVSAGHIILTLTQKEGGKHGDRTHDFLTNSRLLYPLNLLKNRHQNEMRKDNPPPKKKKKKKKKMM